MEMFPTLLIPHAQLFAHVNWHIRFYPYKPGHWCHSVWQKCWHCNVQLENLRKDKDHIIVTADKGVGLVVMDKTEYITKCQALLQDHSFYPHFSKKATFGIVSGVGLFIRYAWEVNKDACTYVNQCNYLHNFMLCVNVGILIFLHDSVKLLFVKDICLCPCLVSYLYT